MADDHNLCKRTDRPNTYADVVGVAVTQTMATPGPYPAKPPIELDRLADPPARGPARLSRYQVTVAAHSISASG